jgi:hypothetical protein
LNLACGFQFALDGQQAPLILERQAA